MASGCNFTSLLTRNCHQRGQSPFPALIALAVFLISWGKKKSLRKPQSFLSPMSIKMWLI